MIKRDLRLRETGIKGICIAIRLTRMTFTASRWQKKNSGDFIVLPGLEAAVVLFDENMDRVKVRQ